MLFPAPLIQYVEQSKGSSFVRVSIVFHSLKLRVAFWAILLALIAACTAYTLDANAADSSKVPDLPPELRDRFELKTNGSAGKMVFIDFYSPYCGV
jgi:hypothetical protein